MSRVGFNPKPMVFLSYARKDGEEFATQLRKRLQKEEPEITLWQDLAEMEGGVGWWKQIEDALDRVSFLVIVMTPAAMLSEMTRKEWRYARQRGVNVYPVKGSPEAELDYAILPNWMRKAHFFDLEKEWQKFVNFLMSDRQPVRVPFMTPNFPEGFVQRPREFEQLIAQLVEEKRENPIAITTALQGAGGYGKTTLAIAICHDDRVIEAFDDGILWVTLGQNPNILGELTKLYEALTGGQPDFVDETQAELKLREKLENRNCLLVIDDVWQKAHLESLLQGGKDTCARLITTRRLDLVMDLRRVQVDEMTPEESVALLAARLPDEHRPRDLRPLRHLAARLMEWPLLLRLAAGVIHARLQGGRDTLEGALDYANRAYDKRGLTAFDPKDAVKRNDAITKSILATLELLDRDERTRLSELAIFPEDTDLPLRIIELLWGLDDLDTQDATRRLADFALLDLNLRVGYVRLHDEIRLYLGRTISDEAAIHARLVDRLGNPKEIKDRYALRWLPWHLGKAGRDARLRALLLDFEWMIAKLEKKEIQSLVRDYDLPRYEPCLHLVRDAIRLSAHVLVPDGRQLASQLTGRLLGITDPDIQALLKQASEKAPVPWLRPLRTSLTPPGGHLIRMLEGHSNSVGGVAITPDGLRAVSASWDSTLRVWDLENGQTVGTLEGHSDWVNGVAITPDGRCAVSAAWDNTLRIWELESGQTVATLEGHNSFVNAVTIMPDGCRAISASLDKTLRVWDLESGQTVGTLEGHSSSVNGVAIMPDGRRAISASWDKTLRIWDLESGQTVATLEGHSDRVNAVTITPDGRRAVSASWENTLRVWDLEIGQTVGTLARHNSSVNGVAITLDGRRAVSASNDKTLRVWNVESGQTVLTLEGHSDRVNAVAIMPDGCRAISASSDNTLRVWDLESGQTALTLAGHLSSVNAVAVTPDGCRAVSASNDNRLKVWNLESAQMLRPLAGHISSVNGVAITPDGRRAVSASNDKTLRVWDLEKGQAVRPLVGHGGSVKGVAVTPDGRRAVSASWDKTLRVWDLESGQTVLTLTGHSDWVNGIAITPSGRRAISASLDGTLRLWDLESGQTVRTLEGHGDSLNGVAITPDGHRALSVCWDGRLRVWDLESGQTVRTLEGHSDRVNGVAIMPDGHRAISASLDKTLKVWDLESGQTVGTLEGHSGSVNGVAITPNGRRAVSVSSDKTLRVWDLGSGQTVRTLTGHNNWVNAVTITPDGHRAISASLDNTLRVWDLESGQTVRTLTGHRRSVNGVAITPDGRLAVSASDERTRAHLSDGRHPPPLSPDPRLPP